MSEDYPRKGHSVHDPNRGKDVNGTITMRLGDGEFLVKFSNDERVVYTRDKLEGNWTDKFGGVWMVPLEVENMGKTNV